MRRVGLQVLSPMLIYSTALASFPPYSFQEEFKPTGRLYKIYAIIFFAFTICSAPYQIYWRISNRSAFHYSPVIKLPMDFTSIFLTCLAIRTTYLNYRKCDELKHLIYKIECFDKAIARYSTRKTLFLLVFLTFHIASAVTIILHSTVMMNAHGMDILLYELIKNFFYYFLCTNLVMVIWIGVEIKFRFDTLNDFLLKYDYHTHETNRSAEILKKVSIHLKSIRMWHNNLCNLVERYNDLFGISMLLFVLFDTASIVSSLVVMLDVIILRGVTYDGVLFGYMVFVCAIYLLGSLVRILSLSVSSDVLEKAAARLTTICYKLLNEVPVVPETDYDVMLNEKLHLIARQSFFRKPHVSGAGCFEVNLEIMGSIASSVTAYIIVFVEFHIKKSN